MALDADEQFRLEQIITAARDNFDELSEWEQGFMVSTEERIKLYGANSRVSEKQWAILDRVYDKVGPK